MGGRSDSEEPRELPTFKEFFTEGLKPGEKRMSRPASLEDENGWTIRSVGSRCPLTV